MAEGSAPPHARRRAPVAAAAPPDAVPECTRCGACCFSERDDYIEVFAVDLARMDDAARALTHTRDGRRFMRFAAGRCTALARDGDRLVCAIYPMRPDACRWLQRESGECLAQVTEKRPRALALLARDGIAACHGGARR